MPASIQPLRRLVGLETEYAIRFPDADKLDSGITHREIFVATVRALKSQLPVGPTDFACIGKEGVFMANGSAVWFERVRFRGETGLMEGCTPECEGPRQVLTWQRAMDRLLSDAVANSKHGQHAALLKNCRDAFGQSYGAQENYEVEFASGWKLTFWKVANYCLLPLSAMILVVLLLSTFCIALLCLLSLPVYFFMRGRTPRWKHDDLKRWFFGGVWFDAAESPYPLWLESVFVWQMRFLFAPVALSLSLLISVLPFRQTQKKLLPFLISRICFTGAGWIDPQGHFHLAEKASSRTREYVHFMMDYDRPIYSLGNFCKLALWFVIFRDRCRGLFRSRQRLQISIGDSNMCEEAEYLKLATTALVIDAIEAGFFKKVPSVFAPLRTLRKLDLDTSLKTTVATACGRMSVLDMQRYYLRGCREYINSLETPALEAQEVLVRWADILEKLETNPRQLVGRLDWVTKQHLLDRAGADSPLEERKKIDLKYAELSAGGYFRQFEDAGLTSRILDPSAIETATRIPPPVKGPSLRSKYIREFSEDDGIKWVSWDAVQLSETYNSRIIHFEAEQFAAEVLAPPATDAPPTSPTDDEAE